MRVASWLSILLPFSHGLLLLLFCLGPNTTVQSQKIVAGYLPDYRLYINVNATTPYLTDLILFSIQPHSRGMVGGCCIGPAQYEQARQAVAYKKKVSNQKLRLWVTIGGAERHEAFFKSIVRDEIKRNRLIQSMLRLCQREGIDGIDLDLYKPSNQEDVKWFHLFSKEASAVWRSPENGLLVSLALQSQYQLLPQYYDYVDRVNLMAYNILRHDGVGHHALLSSAKLAVTVLTQSGCPLHKILLGIPFYARNEDNPNDVKAFYELYDWIQGNDGTDRLLASLEATMDFHEGYRWDSPQAIQEKVDYATKEKLAGVFVWELGQDKQTSKQPGGVLLQTAGGRLIAPTGTLSTKTQQQLGQLSEEL